MSDFDPRDQAPVYFWYTYGAHRVRCDRCGERSPEAAMEVWAANHEGQCPRVRQWKQEAAEQERARLRVLNPGVRGL